MQSNKKKSTFNDVISFISSSLYYMWAWAVYCVTFFQVDIFPKNKADNANKSDNLSNPDNPKEVDTKSNSRFVKSADQFRQLDDKEHNHQDSITTGKNHGKGIVRKKPAQDEANKEASKFQNDWMTKNQDPKETINEIIASEPMRMMLGEEFAPKYRLWKKEDGKFVVVTKMLKNFTTFSALKEKDNTENPKSYDYKNDKGAKAIKYRDSVVFYQKTTAEAKNFNKMLAVCLLCGKDDVHAKNWGIVEKNGEKHAATVDHGNAMMKGLDMYELMKRYGHRKERIVTEEFAKSCLEVVEEFKKQKEAIKQKIAEEIEGIKEFANSNEIKLDVNEQMQILEENSYQLRMIAYQIRAEIAIMENKPEELKVALMEMIVNYEGKIVLEKNDYVFEKHNHIIVPADRLLSAQYDNEGMLGNRIENFEMRIRSRLTKSGEELQICIITTFNKGEDYISEEYYEKMTEADKQAEAGLLAVYNEVIAFAKANEGKTMDQANKAQLSHVERLAAQSNIVTNPSVQR